MARIVFYCNDALENLETTEYYKQDIDALRALGHEVLVCNRYRDFPWRFDAVFIWWWTYAFLPVAFARFTGRKVLVAGVYNFRFDDPLSGTDYFTRPWWQRALINVATRLANANLFVSKREFHDVTAYFPTIHSYYAPCAVSDEYFAAREVNAERNLMFNLAWSGVENLKRKGIWTILDAAAILKAKGYDFELVLAGKQGPAFVNLQRRVIDLNLADRVKAIGEVSQEQKIDLYQRTLLYLQPSHYEGFGLATAEAMAAGCCVIATDVGEVRTVLGDSAIYIEPGDPQGLAKAIVDLLADKNRISTLNSKGALRLQEMFSSSAKRKMLQDILKQVGIE